MLLAGQGEALTWHTQAAAAAMSLLLEQDRESMKEDSTADHSDCVCVCGGNTFVNLTHM
jgi:hypothetical protein